MGPKTDSLLPVNQSEKRGSRSPHASQLFCSTASSSPFIMILSPDQVFLSLMTSLEASLRIVWSFLHSLRSISSKLPVSKSSLLLRLKKPSHLLEHSYREIKSLSPPVLIFRSSPRASLHSSQTLQLILSFLKLDSQWFISSLCFDQWESTHGWWGSKSLRYSDAALSFLCTGDILR